MKNNILEVKDLCTYFPIEKNLFGKPITYLRAVDGVSFTLEEGKSFFGDTKFVVTNEK